MAYARNAGNLGFWETPPDLCTSPKACSMFDEDLGGPRDPNNYTDFPTNGGAVLEDSFVTTRSISPVAAHEADARVALLAHVSFGSCGASAARLRSDARVRVPPLSGVRLLMRAPSARCARPHPSALVNIGPLREGMSVVGA